MPEPGERHIAQELRGLGYTQEAVPEWKVKSKGQGCRRGVLLFYAGRLSSLGQVDGQGLLDRLPDQEQVDPGAARLAADRGAHAGAG